MAESNSDILTYSAACQRTNMCLGLRNQVTPLFSVDYDSKIVQVRLHGDATAIHGATN